MTTKSEKEIKILREGGQILARILSYVAKEVRPGISTRTLDQLAEEEIRKADGKPAFKGYKIAQRVYPATLCISVNDEIVHGIPRDHVLRKGDIVGLDLGIEYKGFFTDTAVTVPVGKIDKKVQKLLKVCREALMIGIRHIRPGATLGDYGQAVQSYVESHGFGVVRELVGHGVGKKVHEDPQIPNWGRKGTGAKFKEGMVIALEPIITEGDPRIFLDKDGWTYKTKDGSRAAHFEHTVLVTKKRIEILTKPYD